MGDLNIVVAALVGVAFALVGDRGLARRWVGQGIEVTVAFGRLFPLGRPHKGLW